MPTSKSFSECTNAEIVQLAQALQDGTITVNDLNWKVGDTRSVSLNSFTSYPSGSASTQAAQTAQLVILHKQSSGVCAGKQFTDNSVPSFIIGFKENVAKSYYHSSNNTYNSSLLKTVEDNIYNALPSDLKPAFKQFKAITAANNSATTASTFNRYMCSPAARELFGGSSASSAGEGTSYSVLCEYNALGSNAQFDYYKTTNNRKHSNLSTYWWERSPRYSGSDSACRVDSDGTAGDISVDYGYGVCPFGCI